LQVSEERLSLRQKDGIAAGTASGLEPTYSSHPTGLQLSSYRNQRHADFRERFPAHFHGTIGGVESSWTLQYCLASKQDGASSSNLFEQHWGTEAVPGPTTMDASGMKWQLLPPLFVAKVNMPDKEHKMLHLPQELL
jgi:hypothetical protein